MIFKHEELQPIEFDGMKIIDYTAGQESSSSFAEITIPAGVSHRFSWSKRSDKYYYVVHGHVTFIVNDKVDNLSQGDVCTIPKGERFKYLNKGPDDAKLILIHTPSFKLECEAFEE
jgi:mannose-6-phosphate isomerase-like protein (cupin superfamily)